MQSYLLHGEQFGLAQSALPADLVFGILTLLVLTSIEHSLLSPCSLWSGLALVVVDAVTRHMM